MTEINEGQPRPDQWKPELPESFQIEFLHSQEIRDGMLGMGFRPTSTRPEGEDKIIITGERTSRDGTTIEVIITRGSKYKSPKEIEKELADKKG